jgi:hypothetical protein
VAGNHNPIWDSRARHTLRPLLATPRIALRATDAWANPGPALGHACPVGSNVPTNFFDNNTLRNDSNGSINLFPSGHPYNCTVGSNQLIWDGTNHLTVNGTFYFDGNLSMSGNTAIVYSGEGTIYFTGSLSFSGTTSLCGITNCTTQWDTGHNVLVLVAGCRNSTNGTMSGCVSISGNNTLQIGIYSNNDYSISGTAVNMGPVIATSGTFSGNATQMIPFATLPSGAPTNTVTETETSTSTVTTTFDGNPQPATNWNG